MISEKKQHVRNSAFRILFAGIAVLLQLAWIFYMFLSLNDYYPYVNLVFSVLSIVVAFRVFLRDEISAFKLTWLILLLGFPILGLCLYFLFGNKKLPRKIRRRLASFDEKTKDSLRQDPAVSARLAGRDPHIANVCRYTTVRGGYPLYENTRVTYYGDAAEGFEAQLADLARAEKFIFMEYHAIEEASSFARLQEVLVDRVQAGVEVRIFYDDVGSWTFIDPGFIRRMQALGISCRVFNPVRPFLNLFMNNRDHRKITVIDGKVGFTGGYNLADEYFNLTHPYGVWKDSGIRLEGDAVKSLTAMFLELWNAMNDTDADLAPYLIPAASLLPASGEGRVSASSDAAADLDVEDSALTEGASVPEPSFVQPYADRPMDGEPLSENVYMNLIKTATERLWITTPYLIISDEMQRELILAAGRGVDVRIVTPGIPDKKIIYRVTRSYYGGLVRGGVKIYEYTPGFLHAKQMLRDDDTAIVGTINLDYRSLYHHFEDGVLLYDRPVAAAVAADFEKLFAVSEDVSEKYRGKRNRTIGQCILRWLAPLL